MRAVCECFHLAKDAGFKVVSHMMPDLPNVGIERDVEQFIVSKHTTASSLVLKKKTYTHDQKKPSTHTHTLYSNQYC